MITSPAAIRAATRLLRVVPVGPARAVAWGAGSVAAVVLRGRRRTVLESLAYLRPELDGAERRRLARRTFANFAAAVVDLLRMPSASHEELKSLVSCSGLEHLDAALAAGCGAIVVTPHLGPYELGGAYLAVRGYDAMAAVENLAPDILEALATFRAATGMRLIPLDRAASGLLRALKGNGVAVLVADRVVGSGTKGIELPFASGMRRVPTGPAYLAIATGAPILVGYITRSGNSRGPQYTGHLDSPLLPDARLDREERAQELTRRVTDRLASIIMSHPDEWYVFQPDWVKNGG